MPALRPAAAALALLAACAGDLDVPAGDSDARITDGLHAHAFDVGMNEWPSELAPFARFRAATGASPGGPRLCHVYTYWDIAHQDAAGSDETHRLAGLEHWFAGAQAACDEVLVTFQGPQQDGAEAPPSATAFEDAFVAFRHLADAGQPLAAWRGRLAFTAWNEPNNPANSGNGLKESISPERAAEYYLAARRHCDPASGCKVAAGDFATNGDTADDIAWNCADDNTPANTETQCAKNSHFNPDGKPPSYLDRYKDFIANHATQYGLPTGFRPEVFAYHPWHDVNGYIESGKACASYDDCATRRLLQSLGGSWGSSEIWDTEIGVGLQTTPAPDRNTTQPCGAAFLVQLTDLSRRVTRVYYMRFGGGNGPLVDGNGLRPAGEVLASRALDYTGAACAQTGMTATFTNPIIPMFSLPAGDTDAPSFAPSEGCPDPTGIKTRNGDFYLYCTSYSMRRHRYSGFPIFKSDSLAGNHWTRVGSIVRNSGKSRASWPSWIRDQDGKRDGNFWAPDVHELPDGKFVATYAAPCGGPQCVGLAWSDSPSGPWTHEMNAPFISKANNGTGWGTTYDPNLLVTASGALYLYWVVGGSGIWGAEVTAKAGGGLAFASAPLKIMDWGAAGAEGPYVVERDGTYYLFYSEDPTGGILYNYQLHVRRASSPLARFDEEGPVVLHKTGGVDGDPVHGRAFVATGGNSVIQDAVDGIDFLVYHAIVVPDGKACPGVDPDDGSAVHRDAKTNPYCRVQGQRQAMLDPLEWKPDGHGGEWPAVAGAAPSVRATMVP